HHPSFLLPLPPPPPSTLFPYTTLFRSLPQTDPATEEVFCEVAAAGVTDVQAAVDGAHRAFTQGWRDLAPRKRTDILFSIAKAIRDRKSTRLNSSHDQISYAVFCLKKKK